MNKRLIQIISGLMFCALSAVFAHAPQIETITIKPSKYQGKTGNQSPKRVISTQQDSITPSQPTTPKVSTPEMPNEFETKTPGESTPSETPKRKNSDVVINFTQKNNFIIRSTLAAVGLTLLGIGSWGYVNNNSTWPALGAIGTGLISTATAFCFNKISSLWS